MAKQRSEPDRVAFQVYRELRQGGEFHQRDFLASLRHALTALEGFREDLFERAVLHIADKVEKESAREKSPYQSLLPGVDWDLGGVLHLPGNRRVDKRLALYRHAQQALLLDDANLVAVQQANMRKRQEMTELEDYWHRPGVTKQQAIEAYEADHQGEAS